MRPLLTWLISGFFIGWLVRVAMGSRRDFGVIGDFTLGLLGGVVGGWLFKRLGLTAPEGGIAHVFVAVTGAATLMGALRLLRRAVYAAGVAPPPPGVEADLEDQLRLLSEFDRRVLARVLGKKTRVEDPNRVFDAQLTFGQRVADRVATFGGSWPFIGLCMLGLTVWMIVNEESPHPFDPYPFILLNLVLSCVAALQAPVIMMSQNRQAAKDRLDARSDYEVNLRAEMEITRLHAKLDAVREQEWAELVRLHQEQLELLRRIEKRLLPQA